MSESELILTLNDSGKSFEIYLEDIITIHLNENRTTPYRWALDKETNTSNLSLQKSHYVLPRNSLFGDNGMLILTFKAKSVDTESIHLKHWCEWEGDDSIIERFNVSISVKD
ncbi:MAG: protease inhibitor I42 family protein [Desulfobulbaceae bacterium]|nr:protease inhibitor I42 family protein [Desulfobulbaceae bacterium]